MLTMIARIVDRNNIIGFRIYNDANERFIMADYASTVNALKSGIEISNLTLDTDGKIKGKGGSLNRYTAINVCGELLTRSSLVIIRKNKYSDDICYSVLSYIGKLYTLRESELQAIGNNILIANGKVVKTGDKYIIQAIEGSYEEGALSLRERVYDSSKVYKLPKVTKNTRLSGRYTIVNSTKFEYIAFRYKHIPRKAFISKTGVAAGGVGGHELLRYPVTKPDNYHLVKEVGIAGIKFQEELQYALLFEDTIVIVNDILYIGDNMYSVVNNERMKSYDSYDSIIVALGQLGLILISFSEVRKELLQVIPYNRLTSKQILEAELRDKWMPPKVINHLLQDNYVNYILKSAQNSLYKISNNIDLHKLPISMETVIGKNSELGLVKHVAFEVDYICKNGYSEPPMFSVGDYLWGPIYTELRQIVGINTLWWFSQSKNILMGKLNSIISDDTSCFNGEVKFRYREIKLRYIAYYILKTKYNISEIDNIPNAWVTDEEIQECLKSIWHIDKIDNRLSFFINNKITEYDIPKLIEHYNQEMEEYRGVSKVTKKFVNKLNLVGADYTVNELGYIIDWKPNCVVTQTPLIKGIKHTYNYGDTLPNIRIKLTGPFDLNITSDKYGRSCPDAIKLEYSLKIFDLFKKEVSVTAPQNEERILFSLEGTKAEDIVELFRLWIIESGLVKRKHYADIKELSLFEIISRSAALLDVDKSRFYPFSIINQDKVSDDEKARFVRYCMKAMQKAKGNSRSKGLKLVSKLFSLLYDGNTANKLSVELKNRLMEYWS